VELITKTKIFDNLVVQIKRLPVIYYRVVSNVKFMFESICLKIEHFYGEFDPGSG
jgi:hypothetical protein